jgi:hypothetical protein
VNILNLCPNIKLVSPVYFGSGIVCPKLSNQQIDISTKMNARFEIYAAQDDFEGALLFKLQRYSDSQHNMNTSTAGIDKNSATHIYMLAAWKLKDAKSFAYVALVEHTKEFTWDENELKKLYDKSRSWLKKYNDVILNTWLMDNNMILQTTFSSGDLKRAPELSISISEKERSNYAMKPLWIDVER